MTFLCFLRSCKGRPLRTLVVWDIIRRKTGRGIANRAPRLEIMMMVHFGCVAAVVVVNKLRE